MDVSVSRAMPDAGDCQAIEALEVRRLRVRRGWSDAAKARLVEESFVTGANVSAIARREGMAPSQLFGWRRKAVGLGGVEAVCRADGGDAVRFARIEAPLSGGMVEIVVGEIVLRAGSDVEPDHLARVIRVVRLA
jgi:transposase